MILTLRGVTFLQGWLLPSHGRQGALCKLGSLSSLAISSLLPAVTVTRTARIVRKEHSTTEEPFWLWFEEGNSGLYLVIRTTCRVGLSCRGVFLSFVRFSGLALRGSLVSLNWPRLVRHSFYLRFRESDSCLPVLLPFRRVDTGARILCFQYCTDTIYMRKIPVSHLSGSLLGMCSSIILPFSSRIRNQVILKIYVLILWTNMVSSNFYSLHHLFSYQAKLVLFYYLLVHTQVISTPKLVSHFGRAITNP